MLNTIQEQELERLINYERATCASHGGIQRRCALPYRPHDELQMELIQRGALAVKSDLQRGNFVVITTDGYSYSMEKARAEKNSHRRTWRTLVTGLLFALAAVLCVLIGFYLGYFVVQ